MEAMNFVTPLGQALWALKGMYDQHKDNANEIKELQSFIDDFDNFSPVVVKRFKEGGVNVIAIAAFNNLKEDLNKATNKLQKWSENKSFFGMLTSARRMQKLRNLHSKIMASMQKNMGIANVSMLLDLQASILESNAELKSLLIRHIGSMPDTALDEVRDEVVEARSSSFADQEFWEDIVVAANLNKPLPPLPSSSANLTRSNPRSPNKLRKPKPELPSSRPEPRVANKLTKKRK